LYCDLGGLAPLMLNNCASNDGVYFVFDLTFIFFGNFNIGFLVSYLGNDKLRLLDGLMLGDIDGDMLGLIEGEILGLKLGLT